MRLSFRIFIALIIIWLGYKAVRQEFGGYELGLFHQIHYLFFALLAIFTIASLLLDTSYYKLDRNIIQYSVSFIGVTFCVIVIYKFLQHNSIDNAKTILKVSNMAGATNVMTFEFKDNKHFRLTENNKLGQTVYYGKYSKRNDSLQILKSNYHGLAKELPGVGIIKGDTIFWNGFDAMKVDE
jgi:hypothetical protein